MTTEAIPISRELKRPVRRNLEPRVALVAGLLLTAIANGFAVRIASSVSGSGIGLAVANTFDISIVVWVGIAVFWNLIRACDVKPLRTSAKFLIAIAIIILIVPLSSLSWGVVTIISVYFLARHRVDEYGRRAMWVALALSLSQQWARWASPLFMSKILEIDALLVSKLSGYESYGNLVTVGDGGQTLMILEACSSFANLSLAYLAWVIARSYYGTSGLLRGLFFANLSAGLVILINTFRIAMIAWHPESFDLIHGQVGQSATNVLTSATILGVSIYGARK